MTEVSRGEFDLLKQIVNSNQMRLESMDQGGSRGVGVVQAQLTEVARDLAELKAEVDKRFDRHQLVHEQEADQRVAGRRWSVGTVLAILTLLVAILALVWTRHA